MLIWGSYTYTHFIYCTFNYIFLLLVLKKLNVCFKLRATYRHSLQTSRSRFPLATLKKMLEIFRITSLIIKTLKFQNTSNLCDGEVTLPVVHVGPSHQVGLVNPKKDGNNCFKEEDNDIYQLTYNFTYRWPSLPWWTKTSPDARLTLQLHIHTIHDTTSRMIREIFIVKLQQRVLTLSPM